MALYDAVFLTLIANKLDCYSQPAILRTNNIIN